MKSVPELKRSPSRPWGISGPLQFVAMAVVEDTPSQTASLQAKVESVQLLLRCLDERFGLRRKVNMEVSGE